MKVKELISELSKYDPEREVYDYDYTPIVCVHEKLWVDGNYPYDRPDEKMLVVDIDSY